MSITECPICMDAIEASKNCVVTDCGHSFHCSCLMQNAVYNGFGCPYCRTTMAPEPQLKDDEEEDDEETNYFDDDEEDMDNVLTSFRMFMQRLDGEEPEEEPEEEPDWITDYGSVDEYEANFPDSTHVTAKLLERGISYETLVRVILIQEHFALLREPTDEMRRTCNELFGQFRAIISRYSRNTPPVLQETANPVVDIIHSNNPMPEVAEPKPVLVLNHNEIMRHV